MELEYHDVLKDKAALERMLGFSHGERAVPVIVEGENVRIGYAGGS